MAQFSQTANGVSRGDARSTNDGSSQRATTPIAIIGMACRFPGNVTSPSQLWDLCVGGKDGWQPIPESRFDNKSLYHKDYSRAGRSHVEGGYFMSEDISLFDAAFFNLAADVASGLDPQARLLLETVYEATEDAAIPIESLAGTNTSVYAGTFNKDYHEIQTKDAEVLPHAFLAGTGTAMISNRISHFFDLQGPSMSIDTGCSAGMVVVHQGCQSIRTGESDISIVGAASTLLTQDAFISASTIGAIGAEGKCFAWDERAHGYGRGEGVAALILQPLDAALKAGNRVHAVIRETGLNQDGKTTTITSPSADAQVKLIRECYARAGYDLKDTGYVEAHMTGTAAGDPIEAEAIARTFGESREERDPVVVGSVKTNVGHTEPVSGLAAIIKTTFALKNRTIPPNLNFAKPNPQIDLQKWHLKVPTTPVPWPEDKLLRASVNNFGYGGTNAHLILEPHEAAPSTVVNGHNGQTNGHSKTNGHSLANGSSNGTGNGNGHVDVDRSRIFVLSARDSIACQTMMDRFATYIETSKPPVDDLAYTLAHRRSMHPWLTAVRARDIDELAERLRDSRTRPFSNMKRPRIAFVFNGQGAQWHAMGRELIEAYPVFGNSLREADKLLKDYGASWSLLEELSRDASMTRVGDINLSQPISVAVQLCLVDLLRSWNIFPTAVTSHSSGEIAAAYATNVLSFKEALGVAFFRGELALKHQKLHSLAGGMLVAAIGPEDVQKYISDTTSGIVVAACINSPSSITLSGDLAAIDEVADRFKKDEVFARKLQVPMAYHSHHMSYIAQEYIDQLRSILPSPPKLWGQATTFVSPVTGNKITSPSTLAPEHWAHNMTQPVLFSQALENMCFEETGSLNVDMIVEVGAHSTLAGPIRQILKTRDTELPYVSCLKRPDNAVDTMQDVACALVARGYPVDLKAINSPFGEQGHLVTDLPAYPWNHTKRFWVEPRISRDQRYKRFPPHEILGTPINGGNSILPTWRNLLRLSEIEWLKDHQIDGSVVFPGAGYIALAIEAVRLLTDPSESTIQAYKLRDINIMNAMVIPDTAFGLETQFSLRTCSDKDMDHDGWYEFTLCSLTAGGAWIEHCKGFVAADTDDRSTSRTGEMTRRVEPPSENTYLSGDTQTTSFDIEALFSGLRDRGIYHGPLFQNLVDSHGADGRAITNFAIADIACTVHDYVLHPTTLDSVLQASFSSLPEDMDKSVMVLPRSIRSLTVPRSFKRQGGEKLQAFSELVKADKRGYTSNITIATAPSASDAQDTVDSDVLQLHGFFGQAVPRRADASSQEAGICSKSCWELDILHNVPAELRASLAIPLAEHEVETERKLVRVSFNFIHKAMEELQNEDPATFEWHHRRMYDWMKKVVQDGHDGKLGAGSGMWAKTSNGLKSMLADELNAQNAAGQLTVRVGRNLAAIIRGEVTPLELMMEGNLLNQFYMDHEALKTRSYKHLSTIAELYAIKNPGANVLEIGAGTGGATTTVLEGFGTRGDGNGTILGHYTFTDISPGFFEAARTKFAAWSSLMDFKKLDIEVSPLEQGFTSQSYDLIVAASCLHATKNLKTTMTHVRQLLKPGGTLLLIEATADRLEGQLIFGTLPGWWLGEEPERQMSPNAPLDMWKRVLSEVGFTGVDFDVPDYEEPDFQSARIMVSRATTTVQSSFSIVVPSNQQVTEGQSSWLADLSNAIASLTGKAPSIASLDDTETWQNTVCIFTGEMETPFVDGMDTVAFQQLKKLLNQCSGLVWLSCGGLVKGTDPAFGATDGLIRTMRQEDASKRWIRLDFDQSQNPWSSNNIQHIIHVLLQSFDDTLDPADVEWEYAVTDSLLHVPRTYPDKIQDALSSNLSVDLPPEPQPFHQDGKPLIWETPKSGATGIDPYFVENVEITTTEVPSGMVEVESRAFGLNFREVMVALGELDEPLKGHESAGVITALGPNTEKSGLKVGDRVCSLVRGRLASRGRTWWTSVAKLPDDMHVSWEHAAAFPAAYVTAYGSLIQTARLQKGETVLIHAASGATGQAAVNLAQHVGAEVYATCSSKKKRDLLVETYGIEPDHVFSSRDPSFAPAIMAATGGKGVDVVLNSLSGALLKATWDCVARFGRLVDITKVDIEANRGLETAPFGRCAVYTSFDLLQLTEYRGTQTHEALTESIRIIRSRQTPPIHPITPFSITDMATAMRQMQGGAHMGKLVLVPNPGDKVNVIVRPRPVSLDGDNATYLIAGGLGGIGRTVAEWFIHKGAKNIVLVSRHASSHSAAESIVQEAEAAKCRLLICDCDISDEGRLLELLKQVADAGLPPITGAITGAMVLDDTVMESMTSEQWFRGVRPKIDGSRNLHKHLPNLSFFIMLSSVAGVAGHMSQANYAAGNTFQDALARHRTANGKPAVAIDLGAVRSVGYVAEREAGGDERLRARVENVGFGSVDIEAVLGIVEAGIRDPLRGSLADSQVIVGPNFHAFASESAMRHDRRFGTLRIASQLGLNLATTPDNKSTMAAFIKAFAASDDIQAASALLVDAMSAKLSDIFNIPLSDIDPELPLSRYGVDSLVAVELRNWIGSTVKAKLSVFEILQSASLNEFSLLVAGKSEYFA
ncbi:hypothetical protein G7054_g8247 [Neopestalotiopsis clavispora]|nr:hypothetical protein G7054_g8247 [Neopestalotiopsis clavispora]